MLPSPKKSNRVVVENRGVPPYVSPFNLQGIWILLGPEDLATKILELREVTDWKI